MDAKEIRKRYSQLVTVRQPYESLWSDVTDLVANRRSNIDQVETPGQKKGLEIYDGSPRGACQQMADGFYGYLCSPSMQWFRLMMARGELNDIPEVKAFLQDCEEQLYYAFNRSNFYAVVPEYFFDGGSIGTATMYAEEGMGQGRIIFMPRHPGEIFISTNRFDEVDTVYRRYKMTARNAVESFDSVSDVIKQASENSPETEFSFLHAVYPNKEIKPNKVDYSGMKYESVYLEEKGKDDVLKKAGYNTFPFFVWRYRVDSGEVYGRSPASDAIVDILSLNQVSKTMLQASQLAVEPAYNVPSEMRGKVRIKPRGMNYYDDPQRGITPVHVPSSLPAGEAQQERLTQIIERNFHTEFFMLLSRAAMEGRQLTVPQVTEMQGEKGAMLGAVVGRLNGDFFDNVIDRVFQIEMEAGRMPAVPEIVYAEGETNIDVEYLGPLAQAQRQLLRTQGIMRGMEYVGGIAQYFPDVIDRINADEVVDEIFDSVGFPQKAVVSVEEANKIRQARAQQQQQMQMMEMAGQMADKVPALSKAPEDGSLAKKVMGE